MKFRKTFLMVTMLVSFLSGAEAKSLEFKILKKWDIPAGGIGMDLLVSEKASKREVLELARTLRTKYLSGGFVGITIYDSIETYRNRDNMDYPQEKYLQHFLVTVNVNPKTGFDKIEWQAKKRRR